MTDEEISSEGPGTSSGGAGGSGTEVVESGDRRAGRLRRITAWILLALASVLCFGTAADVWLKQQVLSTPQWVRAADEVLAQPAVQRALADYLVEEIYANVDVKQEMADLLPESLQGMAGPIAGALRAPATSAVERILGSKQVATIWHEVNTAAHTTLVDVLEDKGTYVSTGDGTVVLDLGSLVREVGTQLGLPSAVMDKVPADAGQITLFESSQLAAVQSAVKVVRILGPILAVVIIALYASAVWLNRGRRRAMLRNVGFSVAIVGLLLVTLREFIGNAIVGSVDDPVYSSALDVVYAIVSRILFDSAWALITWGVLIVVGAFLVGPGRAATSVRRVTAPVFNLDPLAFWGAAAAVYLVVLLWSPTPAFRPWWSVLAMALVIGIGLEHLRRRAAAENPDRRFGVDFDGLRSSGQALWGGVTGWVTGLRGSGDGTNAGPSADPVEQLQRLTALHNTGALSDEEFTAAKSKLLG